MIFGGGKTPFINNLFHTLINNLSIIPHYVRQTIHVKNKISENFGLLWVHQLSEQYINKI